MANNFTSNPIFIDTAGTTSRWSTNVPATRSYQPLYPTIIEWRGPATPGNIFTITDAAASPVTLLTGVCDVTDKSQWFYMPESIRWADFEVTVLDSGTLYIWFVT